MMPARIPSRVGCYRGCCEMPEKSMQKLKGLIGWQSPAFEVEIEQGRVEDFAEAVFDDDPVFSDAVEAGVRGEPAPPAPITFFGSMFFIDEDRHEPNLTFDYENTLHGEQEFSFNRTPLVGETVYGRVTVIDIYQKDRGDSGVITFAELETEFRDTDGELVLTAVKTRIEVSDG